MLAFIFQLRQDNVSERLQRNFGNSDIDKLKASSCLQNWVAGDKNANVDVASEKIKEINRQLLDEFLPLEKHNQENKPDCWLAAVKGSICNRYRNRLKYTSSQTRRFWNQYAMCRNQEIKVLRAARRNFEFTWTK